MHTICIPLHHRGGKFGNNTELRFALRSIGKHFVGDFRVVIIGKRIPHWLTGVIHLEQKEGGLKSALRMAAKACPEGFFWCYDDFCLLRPTTPEEMRITPACRKWSKPKTKWAKNLDSIRARLEREKLPVHDYSRPHGPYWFDRAMVDEGFADWPHMKGKFPIETWMLSKRDWPRCHGQVRQYYGKFKSPPGSGHRYLNYNDRGNTPELREMLRFMFPEPSAFEKTIPLTAFDCRVRGVVIGLENRPRWESRCIADMGAVGIDAELFHGTDAHHGDQPVIPLNRKAFKREFRRDMLTGEIGCFSSHILAAKAAESLPPLCEALPDWRLVFEDDAIPVSIDGGKVATIARLAEQSGYDLVMLNTGRDNRRGEGPLSIAPATGHDPFSHAYIMNMKAAKEMTRWEMRHPFDLAVSKAKQMRVGLLCGAARFDQRDPLTSSFSLHRERRGLENHLSPNPNLVEA